ncbi:MAG: PIG-L family deacetylase [Chitinophagales bacterium]|nr:PIG-L family deacetylase [Chitinophagales bacterium]
MKKFLTLLCVLLFAKAFSNKPSSEIYMDVQKMYSLKKVLYIAAHPDDENTRALAYFSLHDKAETAYFSLTRGDGGQNLIGKELSEDLGVLRTQELLSARSFDGAEQYFSRAVDFGFSKSAKESLEKWGEELILSDVVLMIRKFKPDVIITRFPPDERAGHGHHTASALLAIEAFNLAADPKYLPEQVALYGTWQCTSIYWNSSTWSNPNVAEEAQNNPNYIIKNIGGYDPLLGMSYNEVGTIARSQHKCQGFGAIVERGEQVEYFEYLGGKKLQNDFFEYNTKTWKSLANEKLQQAMDALLQNFNFVHPEKNVTALLGIKTQLESLPNSAFKEEKLNLCVQIIQACLGLYAEVLSDDFAYALGEEMTLELQVLNRSDIPVTLVSIDGNIDKAILLNKDKTYKQKITVKNEASLSTPYWLTQPFTNTFTVEDADNFLRAENKPSFTHELKLEVGGSLLTLQLPVKYKWRDPAYGERERPTVSTPDYTINFDEKSIILKAGETKTLALKLHAFKDNLDEKISLKAPEAWTIYPSEIQLESTKKHQEFFVNVQIQASESSRRGQVLILNKDGEELKSYTEIAYDHIPTQVIFKPAVLECIKLDAQIKNGKIAYIRGAEDVVPEAIAQLGFEVEVFQVADLATLDLSTYQSVVLGIRIYNVASELSNFDEKLFAYVKDGGNLVMQYNTASRSTPNLKFGGPLPFELSRNRVTEEDAPVTFLAPSHPIMNYPNKITQKDFDNWVQERGLYFAANWDERYKALFSWQDEGDSAQEGALIVANYGKGRFVYTGISFFRELPNGVEGAYRLFANLLSYEPKK